MVRLWGPRTCTLSEGLWSQQADGEASAFIHSANIEALAVEVVSARKEIMGNCPLGRVWGHGGGGVGGGGGEACLLQQYFYTYNPATQKNWG